MHHFTNCLSFVQFNDKSVEYSHGKIELNVVVSDPSLEASYEPIFHMKSLHHTYGEEGQTEQSFSSTKNFIFYHLQVWLPELHQDYAKSQ